MPACPGTLALTEADSKLVLLDTDSLSGVLDIGAAGRKNEGTTLNLQSTTGAPTLTLSSSTTLVSAGMQIDTYIIGQAGATLINDGLVQAISPGGLFTFDVALINNGTITTANGDIFKIAGGLTNVGWLDVEGSSDVLEHGAVTNSGTITIGQGAVLTAAAQLSNAGSIDVAAR